MKKLNILIAVFAFTLAISGALKAADTYTFTATATLHKLIDVQEQTALNFGTWGIDPNGASGDLVLGFNDDATTTTDNVYHGSAATGVYAISGSADTDVNITVNTGNTLTNGTTTLGAVYTLDNATVTLDAGGNGLLKVGGSLSVTSSSTPGVYNGTFQVTLSY